MDHVDEQRCLPLLAQLAALGPHQFVCVRPRHLDRAADPRGCRGPRRRRRRASARRSRAGPSTIVTTAARRDSAASSANIPNGPSASNGSTQTSISPPHGSPTAPASASAMPNCSSRGRPSASADSAAITTCPSTQPPDTAPTTAPPGPTAIFAPGGRGAERVREPPLPSPRHGLRPPRRATARGRRSSRHNRNLLGEDLQDLIAVVLEHQEVGVALDAEIGSQISSASAPHPRRSSMVRSSIARV